MYDESAVEYSVYPRVLAVAETGWSAADSKNFEDFSRRLDNIARRMDLRGINYHIPIPEQPDFCRNHVAFTDDSVSVEFTTSRPMKMVYTLDGSAPGRSSRIYNAPIALTESGMIKIRSLSPSGTMSRVREVEVEKQSYIDAVADEPANKGLRLRFSPTRCLYVDDMARIEAWHDSILTEIGPIARLRSNKYSGVEYYAAVAEGFLCIPEDGIYEFTSNDTRVSVAGKVVVDNDGHPQINSTQGRSLALRKGWHLFKVEQISNFIGGWNSQHRNDGAVRFRKYGEESWTTAGKEHLGYN